MKERKPMFDRIKEVLLEYVDVPEDSITLDTRFLADLNMNSMDIMAMVGQIEDELDVTIETEDLSDIFTVGELIKYLEEL